MQHTHALCLQHLLAAILTLILHIPPHTLLSLSHTTHSFPLPLTPQEARERLRRQALDSVTAARSRIRRSASESIAEARARIAAEDAAALAEVHKVIDRYKAGGYVSDSELDWAFAQLEKRSWRPE